MENLQFHELFLYALPLAIMIFSFAILFVAYNMQRDIQVIFWLSITCFFLDCFSRVGMLMMVKFYKKGAWVATYDYVWTGEYCGKGGEVIWNVNKMNVEHWMLFVSWLLW